MKIIEHTLNLQIMHHPKHNRFIFNCLNFIHWGEEVCSHYLQKGIKCFTVNLFFLLFLYDNNICNLSTRVHIRRGSLTSLSFPNTVWLNKSLLGKQSQTLKHHTLQHIPITHLLTFKSETSIVKNKIQGSWLTSVEDKKGCPKQKKQQHTHVIILNGDQS